MENVHALVNKQKAFFQTGETKSFDYRIRALQNLRARIKEHEQKIMDALRKDLNKSEYEAYTTEIGVVLSEIGFALKHLKVWMKPQKVKTPISHIGSKSYQYSEPYGTALIISPWNYPFQLCFAPLIGAIAAGNCAVIKPSEFAPATAEVVQQIILERYPKEYIAVVQGGVKTSQALLNEKFDKIFFTGSVSVGKIVMETAAKHLTPVILELGGKSPCIVHNDARVKLAAKRVAWGKFINAGQTCVAPDYVYVHQDIKGEFLKELKNAVNELYGEDPLNNPDYTHIVSKTHFERLKGFISHEAVVIGGKSNEEQMVIEPTVLTCVNWNDPVMEDEIFGPILPILEYDHLSEVIQGIQNHPNPLALYLFTENKEIQQKILKDISFGGGCINDTIYHLSTPYLRFGGTGNSGMGSYRGKASFDAFSHKKSILKQTTLFEIPIRYPNTKNGLKWIKRFLK